MLFVDVNTFYNPYAGGIRTYHNAKIDWFKKHPEHNYIIVGPADKSEKVQLEPNITYWKLKGIKMQKHKHGYKFLFNLKPLLNFLYKNPEAIVEVGDPWWTTTVFTMKKRSGKLKNQLNFFHHSDPLETYIRPFTERGLFKGIKKFLFKKIDRLFYRQFKAYDNLIVASEFAKSLLEKRGLKKISMFPFGAPQSCFDAYKERAKSADEPMKFLYAGRVSNDKDVWLIVKALPILLKKSDIQITVMGKGHLIDWFENFKHPQFRFLGYVQDKKIVEEEFKNHHILIAPSSQETFGLSGLEGMAMGLPVVGAGRGAMKELLEKTEKPLMFKARNLKSFIETIEAAKSIDLGEYSRDARRVAEMYGTWDSAIDKQMKFLTVS